MSNEADPVLLEVSPDGVAVVTLNRPETGNAVDELLITGLTDALETLKGADHVRVVFVRGAGGVFCSGADAGWLSRSAEMTDIGAETDALALARALQHLHGLPQLTVALVQGAALGDGAGLVAACDFAVAVRKAKFAFSDVKLGLAPATIAPFVVEAIGPRWARALFASGESFDGDLAEKIGLIHYAVDDDAALHAIMTHFTALALAAAPGAAADAKALVRYVAGHKIDDALARETAKRAAARRLSPEGREGLAAFLEKRKPAWSP